MGNIDWVPIADLPDELTDGRDLLVWLWGSASTATARVDSTGKLGWWVGDEGHTYEQPSHFAEINPPSAV